MSGQHGRRERTFIGDEDEALLEERGYITRRLLTTEAAGALLAEVAALEPADGFAPDGTGPNRSAYHCTFLDTNAAYKRQANELIRRTFQPLIDEVLVDFEILTSNLYVKPPGTGVFEIHQNWPTTPDISDTTVTIWCPLIDTSRANGTIEVVPGSHKILPDVAAVGAEKYFEDFNEELIEEWLQPIDLLAGEAVIFDDSLLHWSRTNSSDAPRWAIQIEAVPCEAVTVMPYFDGESDPPRFEFYEVDHQFFVENGIEAVRSRPPGRPLVATVDYANRRITPSEFRRLMDAGPTTRRQLRASGPPQPVAWRSA